MSEHIVVSSWLETDDSSLTSGIFCHSIFPASVTTEGSLSSRGFLRQHAWRHSKLLELRMIHRLLLSLLEMGLTDPTWCPPLLSRSKFVLADENSMEVQIFVWCYHGDEVSMLHSIYFLTF